ncbi:cholinesterase-like isoform X1 [Engystomops pustulosus]|uniref:cholinesterase-like isoform X1 n=1 Tax=Engystomops pustulosus TaxID=76066 RepID=UPI003AFB10D7
MKKTCRGGHWKDMMDKNMWSYRNIFCLAILTMFAVCVTTEDDTIIETKQGKVSGIKKPVISHTVTAYLGIPYAEAPTGEKRFQKPEPRAPWEGIYQATSYGNSCYQNKEEAESYIDVLGTDMWNIKNEMSEDCLSLNVWVPESISTPASVMVYIYGGSFYSGSSALDLYDGSVLAASENVIVVSLNYRLGALGFLAFPGNAKAPGNAGLFDQRLALQWVHENIAAFGGNPDSVTIFGISAGGVSVGYHVISPGSRPYFNRAIMQSGSPTADWAFRSRESTRKLSLKLAKSVDCPTEDDDATIACLQKVDANKLTSTQILGMTGPTLTFFVPILDDDFLTDIPKSLVKYSKVNTDILIGVAKDDGSTFTLMGAPGISVKNESLINTEQLKDGLKFYFPSEDDINVKSVMLLYKDWNDAKNKEKNREALEKILKDNFFTCPAKYFANFVVKAKNNVFVYEYAHRPSIETLPEWMGVIHGAEVTMLFGHPLISPQKFTNQEQIFSRRLMKIWANFARNGNPSDDDFKWPRYSKEEQSYAILKVDDIDVQQNWNTQKCHFWNSFYPELVKLIQENISQCDVPLKNSRYQSRAEK